MTTPITAECSMHTTGPTISALYQPSIGPWKMMCLRTFLAVMPHFWN